MAKIETFSCDICGARKGETNHWYKGFIFSSVGVSFVVQSWNDPMPLQGPYLVGTIEKHLCSENCTSKALSQWMSEQKQRLDLDANAKKEAACGLEEVCGN